jgi:hypothetical protein
MKRKKNTVKLVTLGVLLYFASIYGVPLVLVVLMDLLKNVISDPLNILQYDEVISIMTSLITLLLIGFVISRKDALNVNSVNWFAFAILLLSIFDLFVSFTIGSLIHDILVFPVTLSGHLFNKAIRNRRNKNKKR